MLPKEKNREMEKLAKILSTVRDLYYRKKDQLEELEDEIEEMREVLNYLNSIISDKSFQSADEILTETSNPETETSTKNYFSEDVPQEKMKGTKIKRKVFRRKNEEEQLIAILNLIDMNKLEIKFLHPEELQIQETSEKFIKTFLKGALIEIKEQNPELQLKYQYYKETDIIEKILVNNLKSINNYDLITEKIQELLSKN
ncbi:MAG: hypothetical protein EU543_00945 [Promethearchaeota archaeon]|nr:MAG: hypothetical protein EU543_00945 [Candidatus Lokiarchaeota archaeon]